MDTQRVEVTPYELLRMDIISRVAHGQTTAVQAAGALDLSVRQIRRLVHSFREEGTKGLIHGNRGRPSPRRIPDAVRTQVMALLRGIYLDYNTSHARDELEDEHGIGLSYASVRRLRREAGLHSPKSHRVATHRHRRERAAREGLLLQADGSDHDWLEGRGPRMCLIAFIDDATGRIAGGCFRQAEDTRQPQVAGLHAGPPGHLCPLRRARRRLH
jgi:transposase